jgi:hypothetical protein
MIFQATPIRIVCASQVAIFDCKYLKLQLEERALRSDIQLDFLQVPLTPETANLVSGHEVCSP